MINLEEFFSSDILFYAHDKEELLFSSAIDSIAVSTGYARVYTATHKGESMRCVQCPHCHNLHIMNKDSCIQTLLVKNIPVLHYSCWSLDEDERYHSKMVVLFADEDTFLRWRDKQLEVYANYRENL